MQDPVEINRLSWDERAVIHARDVPGDYLLDRFRAGEDALHDIEATELGDVAGKRVLHLQCHIGRDTLCLVRRGAIATGLDFSSAALTAARRLSSETGLPATFVEGRVEDTPTLAPGPFDLVFVTWGTLCWLPDLVPWAKAIGAVLSDGGELYLADQHPLFSTLDLHDGVLVPTFDYRTPRDAPLPFTNATTYTDDPTILTNQETREWIHALSTIVTTLADAGLVVTMFREHDVLPWRGSPILVPATERLWRLPDGHPRFPLSFSLRARKIRGNR